MNEKSNPKQLKQVNREPHELEVNAESEHLADRDERALETQEMQKRHDLLFEEISRTVDPVYNLEPGQETDASKRLKQAGNFLINAAINERIVRTFDLQEAEATLREAKLKAENSSNPVPWEGLAERTANEIADMKERAGKVDSIMEQSLEEYELALAMFELESSSELLN